MRWWHGEGEQRVTVKGVRRQRGAGQVGVEHDDNDGYLKQYLEMGKQCAIM